MITHKMILDASESHRAIDSNGFLIIKDNPIAKCGVFDYLGESIGLDGNDAKNVFKVYRPYEVLLKTKDLFEGKPVVLEHEWVETNNNKANIVGSISGHVYEQYPYIKANLTIFSDEARSAIESGKLDELSPGYDASFEQRSGEFEGEQYDYVMTDIRYNHLALVETGRSGKDLRVLDSTNPKEKKKMVDYNKVAAWKKMFDDEIDPMLKDEDLDIVAIDNGLEDDDEIVATVDEDDVVELTTDEDDIKDEDVLELTTDEDDIKDEDVLELTTDEDNICDEDINDAGNLDAIRSELKSLAARLDAFFAEEAGEGVHDETTQAVKDVTKTMDSALRSISNKIPSRAAITDAAISKIKADEAKANRVYDEVASIVGHFKRVKPNGESLTVQDMYEFGVNCLSGSPVRVADAYSAFIALAASERANQNKRVSHTAVSDSNVDGMLKSILR